MTKHLTCICIVIIGATLGYAIGIAHLFNLMIMNQFVHVMKIVNVVLPVPVIMEKFNGR